MAGQATNQSVGIAGQWYGCHIKAFIAISNFSLMGDLFVHENCTRGQTKWQTVDGGLWSIIKICW